MHILFAGGGTAGHINPALAIAGYIKERHKDARISYIGTAKKLEATLVPPKGYEFYTIDVAGFQRKLSLENIGKNISAVGKALRSSHDVKKLLRELKPDIVVGTGGYVSGPVVREAQKLGIKTAIHEQNAFPGVTTKMLAPNADRVMLAMPEAEKYLKLKKRPDITGNPVRGELLATDKALARAALGLDERPLLLSFGGSLGAKPINDSVQALIRSNEGRYNHIHATGKAGFEGMLSALSDIKLPPNIELREYIDDMNICMAAADLVICRAGAITLSELQVCGKPSVLIPSPYVAENHQYHNAMTLKRAGCAEVIEEKELSGERLCQEVERLIENKPRLEKMAENCKQNAISDANERFYQILMQLYTTV